MENSRKDKIKQTFRVDIEKTDQLVTHPFF